MKIYCCDKCGSLDVFIDDRGNQKALMCSDCGKWIKWVSKKELPLVERFIESNQETVESVSKECIETNEIKIRFRNGEVGYFKLEGDDIEEFFDYLKKAIRDRVAGVLELIDLSDDKRTIVNILDISTFGYGKPLNNTTFK